MHSANLVVSQARLPNYMYYSGMDFTYKLDRTTVTVGAPSILAISTSPTSVGTSSSASAATGPPALAVAEGSGLPSSVNGGLSPAPVTYCANSGMISLTVGTRLQLLSVNPPTVSQSSSSPDPRGRTMESPAIRLSACNASRTSTRLLYSRNLPLRKWSL
jgi:hypothetical protein